MLCEKSIDPNPGPRPQGPFPDETGRKKQKIAKSLGFYGRLANVQAAA
jgi:hypothetical protein